VSCLIVVSYAVTVVSVKIMTATKRACFIDSNTRLTQFRSEITGGIKSYANTLQTCWTVYTSGMVEFLIMFG
jgi:hypothetical protein